MSTAELDWKKLLCDWRVPSQGRPPGPTPTDEFRTHFESDYDRVVYSQPFRRLARKTQVHPMAPNDHVHNRLTHSVEVASVGRSFARRLGKFLRRLEQLPPERDGSDLAWIMMSASAAHDIGNPPFGHAGEFAIREWTECHLPIVFPEDIAVQEATKRDVLLFEGNAQGFRVAVRSDNSQAGYLRLTFATLGTMVKYPWSSTDPRADKFKKYNCFSSELHEFDCVFSTMGLGSDGNYIRHPMSYLSEAADDICYRVLDLEDAAEIGVIPPQRVREIFACFLPIDAVSPTMPLAITRGLVIQRLIEESWQVFESDYDSIIRGERQFDLKEDFNAQLQDGLARVREAYLEIFSETAKVATELGAFKALGRILKALCNAVAELKRHSEPTDLRFVARRTLDLAWEKEYVTANVDQSYDWWLHQVLDYVSGLTDNHARHLSREIEGT